MVKGNIISFEHRPPAAADSGWVYPAGTMSTPPFDKLRAPLNHQPLLPWHRTPQGPRSAAEWEYGVQARLASKGAIIQASLASLVAAPNLHPGGAERSQSFSERLKTIQKWISRANLWNDQIPTSLPD